MLGFYASIVVVMQVRGAAAKTSAIANAPAPHAPDYTTPMPSECAGLPGVGPCASRMCGATRGAASARTCARARARARARAPRNCVPRALAPQRVQGLRSEPPEGNEPACSLPRPPRHRPSRAPRAESSDIPTMEGDPKAWEAFVSQPGGFERWALGDAAPAAAAH